MKTEGSRQKTTNECLALAARPPRYARPRLRLKSYDLLPAAFCLLLSACCLLSSCSPRSNAFVMALESSPKTLDPLKGFDASSERMRQLMFNTLMRKNEQLDYVPELATPQVSSDGMTVTFMLQDNVKFHDGKPLTAADCKYTFEQLIYKHAADYTKAASFYESVGSATQPATTNTANNSRTQLHLAE